MDKIPYIFMIILGGVVLAIAIINYATGTQTETTAEEKSPEDTNPQQKILSAKGSCHDIDCLDKALRECEMGDTTLRESSNTTMIVSVAGSDTYQGRPVCLISFYEENVPIENNTATSSHFQTWSCKAPIAELRNHREGTVEDLRDKLVNTDYCALQVP